MPLDLRTAAWSEVSSTRQWEIFSAGSSQLMEDINGLEIKPFEEAVNQVNIFTQV